MKKHSSETYSIMVVNEENWGFRSIRSTLEMAGYDKIVQCHSEEQVYKFLEIEEIDFIIIDLTMDKSRGDKIFRSLLKKYPDIIKIIISDKYNSSVLDHISLGAFDYIAKPLEEERIINVMRQACKFKEMKKVNKKLKEQLMFGNLDFPKAFERIITKNKKMLSLFSYVESIAKTSHPVLITGKPGVGKELLARAVHASSRLKGAFVPINLEGMDDFTFNEMMFGKKKDIYRGIQLFMRGFVEQASGGTLYLEKIESLSQDSQEKLLFLLKNGNYMPFGFETVQELNVRIIASTTSDIWSFDREGSLRKDLVYRLLTHHLDIPTLYERLDDDLYLLVNHFIDTASKTMGKKKPTPPKELFALLKTYSFPGNVKELQYMIYEAVRAHRFGVLSQDTFKDHIHSAYKKNETYTFEDLSVNSIPSPVIFPKKLPTLKQTTGLLIIEAMRRSQGNQSIASSLLGISQQALSKRLKQMSISGVTI